MFARWILVGGLQDGGGAAGQPTYRLDEQPRTLATEPATGLLCQAQS